MKVYRTIFISLIISSIFGSEEFGKYSYAIALTNIFVGLDLLTRGAWQFEMM